MRIKSRQSRRAFVAAGVASGLTLVAAAPLRSQQGNRWMEISILPNSDIVTLINIFTVEPSNQERLIQLLTEGTETLMSQQPGYISASFHKSKDAHKVINYAQWKSTEDIEAFRTKREIGEYFKRVREVAEYDTVVCDVSYVHRV
jgi:heme-degrading monooxygenase HmoA